MSIISNRLALEQSLDNIITNEPNLFNLCFNNSTYEFNNERKVPRVTKIISRCINEESLMSWSNYIGRVKHIKYSDYMANAANIGTETHDCIERFMNNDFPSTLDENNHNLMQQTYCAYMAFQKWFKLINSLAKIKVLFHEYPMVCPYFGGTLDGLYSINDMTYIIDYKTSNHIRIGYSFQLAAYAYMLEKYYNTKVNGCLLLKLSKIDDSFQEYRIDLSNSEVYNYFEYCKDAFLSATLWYYNLALIERNHELLKWGEE